MNKYLKIAFWMIISTCFIIAYMGLKKSLEQEEVIFNISPQMDTVEVIIEYDGDREIRWYTLDTIK